MNEDEFLRDSRENRIKPIYLLTGDEFLLERALHRFLETMIAESGTKDIFSFSPKEVEIEEVIANAKNISLIADKKVVLLKGAETLTADMLAKIERYLENPVETTCLLMIAGSEFKDKNFKKMIQKKFNSLVEIESVESPGELEEFVKKELRLAKISADNNAIQKLIELAGDSLYHLKDEIEKLKIYCGESPRITAEVVEDCVFEGARKNFYGMLNGIAERNAQLAISSFRSLIKREHDYMMIMGAIATYISGLLFIKKLSEKGMSSREIESETGESPYAVRRKIRACYKYEKTELEEALKKLLDIDLRMKSSGIDRMVLFDEFFISLEGGKKVRI